MLFFYNNCKYSTPNTKMTTNSLFLDLLFDTTLISKTDKNDIIANIYKNHSESSEIVNMLNNSKFKTELSAINTKKIIDLYDKFTSQYDKLSKILNDIRNEYGDYECSDLDRVSSKLISMCKDDYVNYTNQNGETILFYLLREYYDNNGYGGANFDGCSHSLMDIFDAIILNKKFDIDIKNNKGLTAYDLCKDLGDFDDSDSEDEELNVKYFNSFEIIDKISYRRKLNKKNKQF